jgi:hypothetical protein
MADLENLFENVFGPSPEQGPREKITKDDLLDMIQEGIHDNDRFANDFYKQVIQPMMNMMRPRPSQIDPITIDTAKINDSIQERVLADFDEELDGFSESVVSKFKESIDNVTVDNINITKNIEDIFIETSDALIEANRNRIAAFEESPINLDAIMGYEEDLANENKMRMTDITNNIIEKLDDITLDIKDKITIYDLFAIDDETQEELKTEWISAQEDLINRLRSKADNIEIEDTSGSKLKGTQRKRGGFQTLVEDKIVDVSIKSIGKDVEKDLIAIMKNIPTTSIDLPGAAEESWIQKIFGDDPIEAVSTILGWLGSAILGVAGAMGLGALPASISALISKTPQVALLALLGWTAIDAFTGWFKGEEWGTTNLNAAVGKALGGGEGGLKNAIMQSIKWGGIGAIMGSVGGIPGVIIGGLLGIALGAIAGYFGGSKVAQTIQSYQETFANWLSDQEWFNNFVWLIDQIFKIVTAQTDEEIQQYADELLEPLGTTWKDLAEAFTDTFESIFEGMYQFITDITLWWDSTKRQFFEGEERKRVKRLIKGSQAEEERIAGMPEEEREKAAYKREQVLAEEIQHKRDLVERYLKLMQHASGVEYERLANIKEDYMSMIEELENERKGALSLISSIDDEEIEMTEGGVPVKRKKGAAFAIKKRKEKAAWEAKTRKMHTTEKADDAIWRSGVKMPFNKKDNVLLLKDNSEFEHVINSLNEFRTRDQSSNNVSLLKKIDELINVTKETAGAVAAATTPSNNDAIAEPAPGYADTDVRDPAYILRNRAWAFSMGRPPIT